LSISIDPTFDTPPRLQGYRSVHGGHSDNWYLTRPANDQQLQTIMDETGLRVIPDKLFGFSHSDSIHVVRDGKLIAIYDYNSVQLEQLVVNTVQNESDSAK